MTESATRKPLLTRRRVIAAAVLLVFVLAVAGLMFGVFDGKVKPPVKLTFARFEEHPNLLGRAVITVSNFSDKASLSILFGGSDYPTRSLLWRPDVFQQNDRSALLKPGEKITGGAYLPRDGGVVRVAVRCSEEPEDLPVVLAKLRELWWKLRPPRPKSVWAMCDQEIQCPQLRPDGTIEPPRLVPKGEHKP